MRTQIIHLDSHDDHVSARDKMGWTQTQRIILVWPESGQVLDRRLDLILVKRHSHTLGAELAIVTRNRGVVQNAKVLGIPVFRNLIHAKRLYWQKADPVPNPPNASDQQLIQATTHSGTNQRDRLVPEDYSPFELTNPLLRILAFAMGVVAVLLITGIFLPNAEIHLKTETYPQELIMTLSAGPDIEAVSLSGEVPTEPSSLIVEGRTSIPTSGSTLYPETHAKGRALLTNLSENTITLKKGAIFRSSDDPQQRYETIKSVIIEPWGDERVPAALQALNPGASGNLIANSTLILEGPDSISITAINPLPVSGGKDILVPAVDLEDQRKLYRILESQLRNTALEELIQESPNQFQVITPTLILKKVIDEYYFPSVGQPADQVDLNLRLEYEIQTINHDTVVNLVQQVMDAHMATGDNAVDSSLHMDIIGKLSVNNKGNATWNIKASRDLITQIDGYDVAISSLGLVPQSAIGLLRKKYSLPESPEIVLSPAWWPRLPLLPFRIDVFIYQSDQPSISKNPKHNNRA